MLDLILFLFEQFFNVFMWLDSLTIIGSLSILRIIIIIFVLIVIFHIIGGKEHD